MKTIAQIAAELQGYDPQALPGAVPGQGQAEAFYECSLPVWRELLRVQPATRTQPPSP